MITFLEMFSGGVDHLHGHDLETTFLETSEDLAYEVSLNAIRLDHDETLFSARHIGVFVFRKVEELESNGGEARGLKVEVAIVPNGPSNYSARLWILLNIVEGRRL
jgi:hypothetical protein